MSDNADSEIQATGDIPLLFGSFLVRESFVSYDELADALSVQSEVNQSFLATALIEGFIDVDQFRQCTRLQREKGIGSLDSLLELGVLGEAEITAVGEAMARNRLLLGELLVRRGCLTREQLDSALLLFKIRGFV